MKSECLIEENGFEYIIQNDDTIKIVGYRGTEIKVIIPSEINNREVAIIGEMAFLDNCFAQEIVIPESVVSIESSAFYGCKSITSIVIPKSVESMGVNPFARCNNLTQIIVSPENQKYETVNNVLFDKTIKKLICYPVSFANEVYSIPDGIEIIGESTFECCYKIKSITMPNSIKTIEVRAFAGCHWLQKINWSTGLVGINDLAFESVGLENIRIPESVEYIGESAFAHCSHLSVVTIDGKNTIVDKNAFCFCRSLERVILGDGVKFSKANPFAFCPKLSQIVLSPNNPYLEICNDVLFSKMDKALVYYPMTLQQKEYTIPNGVEIIAEYAFACIDKLTYVKISSDVKYIKDNAFDDCYNLKKIDFSESVISLGEGAFNDCRSLEFVNLVDGIREIGGCAFSGCDSLVTIKIPDSVDTINSNPFTFCDKLNLLMVSKNHSYFEMIGGALFSKPDKRLVCYLSSLKQKKYVVPQGTEIIGEQSFTFCQNLESVIIPNSVVQLGRDEDGGSAFFACHNLSSVVISDNVTRLVEHEFMDCDKLSDIDLPSNLSIISDGAFINCHHLKSVVIPENVKSIGERSFWSCDCLSYVSIPESVNYIGQYSFMNYNSDEKKRYVNSELIIDVVSGSYAEKYCKDNKIKYTCFGKMEIAKQKSTVIKRVTELFNSYDKNVDVIQKLLDMLNKEHEERVYTIEDTDHMTPFCFEEMVAKLFNNMGYDAYSTKKTGDQGVDVIARKGHVCIAIQTKCFSRSIVSNSAIQEVVAGMKYYNATEAYVITNSSFTRPAADLARANDVSIWDRNTLREMLKLYPVPVKE